MSYRVEKSVAENSPVVIAECDSFDEAVAAAEDAGATGAPIKNGRNDWCFSGGPDRVGYWITAI